MKKIGTKICRKVDRFHGALCLEKALATDSIDLPAAHTSLVVLLSRKALRNLKTRAETWTQKMSLLSTEDVEMWVTHLDSVKKRRQAGVRKTAATRKQKSARQSSDKVATAGNEFWCLCGGPESGNMIACDNPGCPIEWFHFECVGLVDAPSGKWLCTECAV